MDNEKHIIGKVVFGPVVAGDAYAKATIPRKRDESVELRALEIGQMRILARKWPREFRKVAEEIVEATVKL